MKEYQLRGQDEQGQDTGELRICPTLEEAFEEFLTGKYWKLSWTAPSGKRVRLLRRDDKIIEVTDPAKMLYQEAEER